jgi:exopolysaccharide production protein ExoZ
MTPAGTPLRSIQALRGVAALAVMAFHISQWMTPPLGMRGTPALGSAGVDLFFVISGMVLWLSVNQRPQTALQFLRNRAARVLPLYWTATLGVAAVVMINPAWLPAAQFEPLHLVQSLLLVPHISPAGLPFPILAPGWSLTYEALFYLVVAASLLLTRDRRLGFVAVAVTAIWLYGYLDYSAAFLFANAMVLEFLAGVVIAQIVLSRRPISTQASLFLALLGGGLFLAQIGAVEDPRYWRALVWGLPAALVVAGLTGLDLRGRWPPFVPMEQIGDVSYSLYLCHWPVVWLVGHSLGDDHGWRFALLASGLSLTLAFALRHGIEKPAMRLLGQGR